MNYFPHALIQSLTFFPQFMLYSLKVTNIYFKFHKPHKGTFIIY